MDVAVDLIAFAWDESEWKILLIERKYPPFEGKWALPGGFVEKDEDLPDAARRELLEETGVQLQSLAQIGTFGKPDRDPRKRVISVAYCAILHELFDTQAGDDAAKAIWFPLDALPELAFDHDAIVRMAIHKMQDMYTLSKYLPASGPLSSEAIFGFKGIVLK
ncbi:MAG: NUDIX hydrolase [Bacteroidetes bacterium]|nr:MAG: NUDIX hydrolase [Bacteroidota bacterium]